MDSDLELDEFLPIKNTGTYSPRKPSKSTRQLVSPSISQFLDPEDSLVTTPLASTFDDLKEIQSENKESNLWDATFNFTNSIIGAGIIGMPYALQQAGLVLGLILLIFLTLLVDWTVNLLVKDAKLAGRQTYQGLMYKCFGKRGLLMISVFQFTFAYGAICAYQIIIGDTLPAVFSQLFTIKQGFFYTLLTSRMAIISLCALFISLPLSLFRNLSKLSNASFLSLLAMLFIILSVCIRSFTTPPKERGILESIGVIAFAFVCHHNSLMKPTLDRFALVTHLSTGASFICCVVLGIAGYLTFTDLSRANILNNYGEEDVLINIARACFACNMFLTIPLECFVCREYCFTRPDDSPSKVQSILNKISLPVHVLTTCLIILSGNVIALLTCDLGAILEITVIIDLWVNKGGISATNIAFILPPLCYLKLKGTRMIAFENMGPLVCILFGIFVMVSSTFLVISKAIWSNGQHNRTC